MKPAAALQRWAADDLRSVNGQVELLLRRALAETGRLPERRSPTPPHDPPQAATVRDA